MRHFPSPSLLVAAAILAAFAANAAPATNAPLTAAQTQFFENKIRPVLAGQCYKCHSAEAEKLKGGLYLDSREGWQKGGDNGPALVPGDPEKSLLIKAVRYTDPDLQMPPKGEKLTDAQIADLTAWVKMGAPDPRTGKAAIATKKTTGKDHWAFKPVTNPTPPQIGNRKSPIANPIDAFILARLDEKGLKPSPPADKRTLIRRAYFDLIGLPPTPEEVEAFLEDKSPDAFAKVVDRLLASPHYGERWGRHWLDVARYSDTKGDFDRRRETPLYPHAWTYRDYVIRAFNEDKPYNFFVAEQIAADRIPASATNGALAALGFLTVGERFKGNANDIINDRIDVVTKGFLGLSVSCARCHDHMFDPIPTKDYYSLHGIFASSVEPQDKPILGPTPTGPDFADYLKQKAELEKQADALEEEFRELRVKLRKSGGRQEFAQRRRELQREQGEVALKLDGLELRNDAAPPRAMVLVDSKTPKDSRVFIRGEADNKGPAVPRQFLECLSNGPRQPFQHGSGRLDLAWAIASTNNPLTARVMVNRIWQHHFGEGIVSTPDDFGSMGSPPSHPELLDWLAARFMAGGWSMKAMHRLILTSATWQQSSENNPRYAQIDPFNRLLWRANLRRLEFEPLRDSLLAIGGRLDPEAGGRPVQLAGGSQRRQRIALALEPGKRPDEIGYTTRRTVYGYVDRGDLPEVFNHFDFATPDMATGRRHETMVPQHALYLMNSPLVVEQARNLIERPELRTAATDEEKIRALYEIVFQREPRAEELALGLEFLETATGSESLGSQPVQTAQARLDPETRAKFREAMQKKDRKALRELQQARGGAAPRVRPITAWAEYAHALLLSNEAAFVN
jgi:cytochrome c553